MSARIGSLFSGYGGLDQAVETATGATTAWVSDIDKGACKILAHRYPDVPNLGDLTAIDWSEVEPVDIITGGFPCQDLSHAGKRAGMTSESRSGLWSYMHDAIRELRPRLVVAENVRGLLSAEALRPVEPCPFCLGDGSDFDLRALGSVLADLADIGYDAQWCGLRAADVGACHGRFRVFLVAYPRGEHGDERRLPAPDEATGRRSLSELAGRRRAPADLSLLPTPAAADGSGSGRHNSEGHADTLPGTVRLLPTPTTQDGANNGGPSQLDRNSLPLNTLVTLLPTPAVNDMGKAYTPDEWDAWTAKMQAAHGNGNGHGKSLEIEAARLLPTPKASNYDGSTREDFTPNLRERVLADFGDYAGAIDRWESVIGRPAPAPTEPTGKGGAHRLSPEFTSWMMGLPDGWITDVPGITRNEALKACGNGVVPQQAFAAITHMLAAIEVAA